MMNHSSSEPRDAPGAFRVWANAHGEFAGPEQALARALAGTVAGAMADAAQDDEIGRLRAEALAAIEATADLTWWDLVNYHGAWS